MIRIIKSGSYAQRYIKKCYYCSCEFDYQFSDTYLDDLDFSGHDMRLVDCPECLRSNRHEE